MVDERSASIGKMFGFAVLATVCLPLWGITLATMSDLDSSDAAGRGYVLAFGALELFLLFAALAGLTLLAAFGGAMPKHGKIAAFVLVPLAFAASCGAFGLLEEPSTPPGLAPLIIPEVTPVLIVAYGAWSLSAALRRAIPERVAAALAWGGVLALCIAYMPFSSIRDDAYAQQERRVAQWDAAFAALPADAPLAKWIALLPTATYLQNEKTLTTIRNLPSRQADAEAMLDRDEFPFDKLSQFDLDPTPTLCAKVRAALMRRIEQLPKIEPQSRPISDIETDLSSAAEAMEWLVGFACPCTEESLAWETAAKTYRDADLHVERLEKLRDPAELGRVLDNYPPKFSMLTPKAHLWAWLEFTDDKDLRDKALAGARKLDHRNAEAVEMLNDKYAIDAPWKILAFLPQLDLDATPALCDGALTEIRKEFAQVYRPKPDDEPHSYRDLLDRLGVHAPLTALQWLAGHGCPAEAELTDAEAIIRAYQDSPARAAILANLAALHAKP